MCSADKTMARIVNVLLALMVTMELTVHNNVTVVIAWDQSPACNRMEGQEIVADVL
jgi:hypothetical protein